MSPRPVLYVDDDAENLSTLRRVLRGPYDVETLPSGPQALMRLKDVSFPVLIADQRMPLMSGVEFLREASKTSPDSVGVLLTAYADMDALVDGVNAGLIYRYLTKPYRQEELLQAVGQAFEKYDLVMENRRLLKELEKTNRYLTEEICEHFDFASLAGADNGLKDVVGLISKVANTNSTVLIRGESGVGKELVARSIHQNSGRKVRPFVRVNCGSLAEGLLESELFGHEKGAFTGALARRIGRFESADKGTIFLDEVGDLSAKLQVSLLRVLQEREFERVGGNETLHVDVRVIAATHQDLEALSKEGKFRQDLYYRLNVFPVVIPPLRQRLTDLPALIKRVLVKVSRNTGVANAGLSALGMEKLLQYDWPGNVRELENVLERAVILSSGEEIGPEDLVLGPGLDESWTFTDTSTLTKEQIEKVLSDTHGNKVEAARRLGIKRPTLYYHLKRFGIV